MQHVRRNRPFGNHCGPEIINCLCISLQCVEMCCLYDQYINKHKDDARWLTIAAITVACAADTSFPSKTLSSPPHATSRLNPIFNLSFHLSLSSCWLRRPNEFKSRSQWPRGVRRESAAARGFESHRVHGCLSLVRVQVEVSAMGRSLALRNPSECALLECDLEISTMRRLRPTNSTVHVIPSSINQEPKMEIRNCVAVALLHTIRNNFTALFSYLTFRHRASSI